jgi:hypothetical protein
MAAAGSGSAAEAAQWRRRWRQHNSVTAVEAWRVVAVAARQRWRVAAAWWQRQQIGIYWSWWLWQRCGGYGSSGGGNSNSGEKNNNKLKPAVEKAAVAVNAALASILLAS